MEEIHAWLHAFTSHYDVTSLASARELYRPRDPQANKGDFGHVLLLAGSYGKMGAALMAAGACLRSGAGLLTTYLPGCGFEIMQGHLPEAMVITDKDQKKFTELPADVQKYSVVAAGPGIGTAEETAQMLGLLLDRKLPAFVLDADGLNLVAERPEWLNRLPPNTVITPHPKEFDRLFGPSPDITRRLTQAARVAVKYRIVVVLKGHFTGVFAPDGNIFFNTSGNAGMAKGGSGDVLTGMVAGMLAQKYPPVEAARLAVFLHGLAGDIAASEGSPESMLPTDLILATGKAYLQLAKK